MTKKTTRFYATNSWAFPEIPWLTSMSVGAICATGSYMPDYPVGGVSESVEELDERVQERWRAQRAREREADKGHA